MTKTQTRTKAAPIPTPLDAIRADIASTLEEIAEVKGSGLPVETVETQFRQSLTQAREVFEEFIGNAGRAIAAGDPVSLVSLTNDARDPKTWALLGLGAAVAAHGEHRLLTLAHEAAARYPQAEVRMSAAERESRLETLEADLYAMELDEEASLLPGVDRRHNARIGPVLGIPFDVALEHGLIGGAV